MNYPIMYYALDVRRVILRRILRVWSQITRKAIVAQRRRGEIFSNPVFATNKNPDWRSRARAYLEESIQESRGGGGSRKVGGRSIYLHTPAKNPRTISEVQAYIACLLSPTVTPVRNDPLNTACRTLIEESIRCEDDRATLQGA